MKQGPLLTWHGMQADGADGRRYEVVRGTKLQWILVLPDVLHNYQGKSLIDCKQVAEDWELKCQMDARMMAKAGRYR